MNQQLTMEPILPQQTDTLQTIIQLANELRTTSEEADALAIDLKKKQERLKQLAEDHLPLLMTSVGLTELSLVGGGKIKIKPDYYETEVQAWAAILAHCADSVHHVERRGMELNKRMEVNVLDLVRRRAAQRSAEQAFREWKQRHPLSASA